MRGSIQIGDEAFKAGDVIDYANSRHYWEVVHIFPQEEGGYLVAPLYDGKNIETFLTLPRKVTDPLHIRRLTMAAAETAMGIHRKVGHTTRSFSSLPDVEYFRALEVHPDGTWAQNCDGIIWKKVRVIQKDGTYRACAQCVFDATAFQGGYLHKAQGSMTNIAPGTAVEVLYWMPEPTYPWLPAEPSLPDEWDFPAW